MNFRNVDFSFFVENLTKIGRQRADTQKLRFDFFFSFHTIFFLLFFIKYYYVSMEMIKLLPLFFCHWNDMKTKNCTGMKMSLNWKIYVTWSLKRRRKLIMLFHSPWHFELMNRFFSIINEHYLVVEEQRRRMNKNHRGVMKFPFQSKKNIIQWSNSQWQSFLISK